MKVFNSDSIENILGMDECIKLMSETLIHVTKNEYRQYLRTAIKLEEHKIFGLMPASLDFDGYFGAKIITVFHGNTGTKYPSHQGPVLLFEKEHGQLIAMLDGAKITEIRTAAVSAVATDVLSRKDAKTMAILGAGTQAKSHAKAISKIRDIEIIYNWDISSERSLAFAEEMSNTLGIAVMSCPTAKEAVKEADIICTVTPAKTPILLGTDLKSGAHINSVGACAASDRELDSDAMKMARVFSDNKESVFAESGNFLIPLKEGLIDKSHLLGELGDVLTGNIKGRQTDDEITVFEALGLAVEDVAAAYYIYGHGDHHSFQFVEF